MFSARRRIRTGGNAKVAKEEKPFDKVPSTSSGQVRAGKNAKEEI